MTDTTGMPRYKSHKTVHALEIDKVGWPSNGTRSVAFKDRDPGLELPDDMFSRYSPVPGDFLVVYEDGYKSFSPRKAFLDGYTRET